MDIAYPNMGLRPVARCDALGGAPFSEDPAVLVRPYLTSSHRLALDALSAWMEEAGMSVRLDPLGNLIGRYEGRTPGAPALILGSHIDTVPDGGRYDGALGVMLGLECVEHFHRRGVRLPFALEVIAFGDEEGSRFPASMLCSAAIAGGFDPAALELTDLEGVTLAEALAAFDLDPAQAAKAARRKGEVLGYLEAHIEQGPVLEADGLPIGIVTGIAAQLRLVARFKGVAGHAGTTPMRLRSDALAAAADGVIAVERICAGRADDLVGTVGKIRTATQAFNVIVGEAEIGVDIRAGAGNRSDADPASEGEAVYAARARRGVVVAMLARA
jgi:allantoate deiminase